MTNTQFNYFVLVIRASGCNILYSWRDEVGVVFQVFTLSVTTYTDMLPELHVRWK